MEVFLDLSKLNGSYNIVNSLLYGTKKVITRHIKEESGSDIGYYRNPYNK